MKNIFINILTGILFVSGIAGFLSGEYIISSTLFATATFTSNLLQRQS